MIANHDELSEKADIPSIADEDDFDYEDLGQGLEPDASSVYSPVPIAPAEADDQKKKCLNKSLISLKLLLFFFYGGVGVITTWLNNLEISKRFNDTELFLVYGLSALLSLFTPFIFGIISDKSAQPKKVLAVILLLTGLIYPLILLTQPAAPHDYKSRYDRCNGTNRNGKFCLPTKFVCGQEYSKIVSTARGCSEKCYGKLVLSNCVISCTEEHTEGPSTSQSPSPPTATLPKAPSASIITTPKTSIEVTYDTDPSRPEALTQDEDYVSDSANSSEDEDGGSSGSAMKVPHICVRDPGGEFVKPRLNATEARGSNGKSGFCYAYSKSMGSISVNVEDIDGEERDGVCHYPLLSYSAESRKLEKQLYCDPVRSDCAVSCKLDWEPSGESNQWRCKSDYLQWASAFGWFVGVHALGTMLLITSAALLNGAILSMTHEHTGYYGCQLMYGGLGFVLCAPGLAFVFEHILKDLEIPWELQYFGAYSFWLVLCSFLTCTMPYHAEWVPKPGTISSMLCRWMHRSHTIMFFVILVILGASQGTLDALGFLQIQATKATLVQLGLGGAAALVPALLFIYRVEKVIEYCGYHNILAIALVVQSLQFTGYAYLKDVIPEWSYLLKALDTFSIVTVWVTAAHTAYSAAPRRLVGTCQAFVATLYCSLGRGLGGIAAYFALSYFEREMVLKACAILSVIICLFYLVFYYYCLKHNVYSRKYDVRPGSPFSEKGKYTPLKMMKPKSPDRSSYLADKELEDTF